MADYLLSSLFGNLPRRRLGGANLTQVSRAAGMEGAAAGKIDGVGYFATKMDRFTFPGWISQRDGGEQGFRVGMVRGLEKIVWSGDLHQ